MSTNTITPLTGSVPAASFTADLTTLRAMNQTVFTDTSTNSPTVWLWNFGDGRTSTVQNPAHQWNQPGTFYVTLTATNVAGSGTSTQMRITVLSPQVNLSVFIGSTDVTSQYQIGSLNVTGAIGMRKTSTMTLHNANTFRPIAGQVVLITDTNTGQLIFGGEVWSYDEYDNELSTDNWYDLSMTSFDGLADRRLVNNNYVNMTADAIVLSIASQYLAAEGVTTYNVQAGPLISSASWAYKSCAKCFDELCTSTGYSWYIDDYRDLHFYATISQTCPISLTDTSNNWRKIRVSRGMADYFNVEYIEGANATADGRTESFHGNGTATQFTLSRPCVTTPTITLNGVAQTVGVSSVDTGKQWYWSSGGQGIVQDQSGTALGAGDTLKVKFQWSYPNMEVYSNPSEITNRQVVEGGGTGRYESYKSLTSLTSPMAVATYLTAEIKKYGRVSEALQFETDNPSVMPGQVMSAVIAQHGVNGSYLITQVEIKEVDKALLTRTVTAQGGLFLSQWTDYWKAMAAQGAGATSTGVGSGGANVLLMVVT